MKKTLCVLIGLALCGSAAIADDATVGDLDVFFSTSNAIQHMTPGAPEIVVDTSGGPVSERLYIWANIDHDDFAKWNGLGLNFVTEGGVSVTGGELYNPNMGPSSGSKGQTWEEYEKFRWQNGAVGGSEPNNPIPMTPGGYLNASAVSGGWLLELGVMPAYGDYGTGPDAGDELAYSNYAADTTTWTLSYLLGHIDVEVSDVDSAVNFAISSAWCTLKGDTDPYATVRFGLNDEVSGRVTGAGGFADERVNDVTFTPEPASLVLLVLSGLLLRRR